ncbi:hypothetical protein ANN_11706 [Periplaneta americana]|uniref:Uncharacterized protein n=1 Tax=Periplaneta americana TaxID=6978 RepID=A0ABQ8T7K6_PERAM|nr:hypothetical protein ANN_11706 [Periplaneta americana]
MAGLCEDGNELSGSLIATSILDVNVLGEYPQTIRHNTEILLEVQRSAREFDPFINIGGFHFQLLEIGTRYRVM